MLAAKSAVPDISGAGSPQPVLVRAVENPITLFTTPPGYLMDEGLAVSLAQRGQPVLWLRAGHEDRDPATFLLSLIESAQRLQPEIGKATRLQMQRRPGPTEGWQPLYAQLADELASSLPPESVIVLEHIHELKFNQPTLELVGRHLLANLPDRMHRILIAHESIPAAVLPPQTVSVHAGDLRLDSRASLSLAEKDRAGLSGDCVRRAVALTEGQAGALAGIFSVCGSLGSVIVKEMIEHARDANQLLAQVVVACTTHFGEKDPQVLALQVQLGYSRPEMLQSIFGTELIAPAGPWLQPLEDRWERIRCLWKLPLQAILRVDYEAYDAALFHAAEYLASHGDLADAVRLYFGMGDPAAAARVMISSVERMMDLGQWWTLKQWLKRLPPEVLYDWPRLVYIKGEIAAASGSNGDARRSFATAASLYSNQYDREGTCQSLSAEATVAAWDGDLERAQFCAQAANVIAHAAGLTWQKGLTSWQLGCLAVSSSKLDQALAYFGQAASMIQDPTVAGVFTQAETLATRERELNRQKEYHRRSYLSAERSDLEILGQLNEFIGSPPENRSSLLGTLGWSKTPLMFKLDMPPEPGEPDLNQNNGLWQKIMARVKVGRTARPNSAQHPDPDFSALDLPLAAFVFDRSKGSTLPPGETVSKSMLAVRPIDISSGDKGMHVSPETFAASVANSSSSELEQARATEGVTLLSVHALGVFQLFVNNKAVQKWPGTRGLSVLKYLLLNHAQKIPREILMDTFWRDNDPSDARNNLNVSLHSLRITLRELTDAPVVVFERCCYFINPEIRVWIDVEEFEHSLQAGRQFEVAGELAAAIKEYEVAAQLYQGDFLKDDLYEEWPLMTRERLRIANLDLLDHLSQIYFNRGQYSASMILCQRILECDACREDAHSLLMRCYSRQGQQHLAIRQYQACLESLRAELDVDPEPATTELAERIRRREAV